MKHNNTDDKYAFLMVEYETPDFIKELQGQIKDDELYVEDGDDSYGLEQESHVTLVPCLELDADIDVIKELLGNLSDYGIVLTDVSKFECDKFDVLKCAVKSDKLMKTNSAIKKKFKTHSDYKEYAPHMTIAYMKHGMADKYLSDILGKLVHLKPKNFHFSTYDKDGKEVNIRFK